MRSTLETHAGSNPRNRAVVFWKTLNTEGVMVKWWRGLDSLPYKNCF